jgi:hypothetical protein
MFGIISASKRSIKAALKKPGVAGCVVLYVGGMAELFLSCEKTERVYLKKRKGFIKLALQEGKDIIPVYLFGNTTVLSVLKTGLLASISRRLQVSFTYIWGRWGLPIPRDCKVRFIYFIFLTMSIVSFVPSSTFLLVFLPCHFSFFMLADSLLVCLI